jgi:hypothetical protein
MSTHPSLRRRLRTAVGAAPLVVLGLLVGPANAAQSSTDVVHTTEGGLSLIGNGSTHDGPCETTYQVVAEEELVSYMAHAQVGCAEDELMAVSGVAVPTLFEVRALRSGRVVADIPLVDHQHGGSAGVVHVDNTWTAKGRPSKLKFVSSQTAPGIFRQRTMARGWAADASVTGTVPLNGFSTIGRELRVTVTVTFH